MVSSGSGKQRESEGMSEIKNWCYLDILVICCYVVNHPKFQWQETTHTLYHTVSANLESEHVLAEYLWFKIFPEAEVTLETKEVQPPLKDLTRGQGRMEGLFLSSLMWLLAGLNFAPHGPFHRLPKCSCNMVAVAGEKKRETKNRM